MGSAEVCGGTSSTSGTRGIGTGNWQAETNLEEGCCFQAGHGLIWTWPDSVHIGKGWSSHRMPFLAIHSVHFCDGHSHLLGFSCRKNCFRTDSDFCPSQMQNPSLVFHFKTFYILKIFFFYSCLFVCCNTDSK